MKKLLFILLLLPFLVSAQVTITYTQKDTTGVDDNRPFTGLIDYYNIPQRTDGRSPIPYPNPAGGVQHAADTYFRLTWDEWSKGTTSFDNYFKNAITRGQSIGFRLVSIDDSYTGNVVDGNRMSYPSSLHTSMQMEANPDFKIGNVWWPNYNSNIWLANWRAVMVAIANHINTTSFNGVKFSDVLAYMDIGGIGIYGEGHRYLNIGNGWAWPTGTQWTLANLKEIVQAQMDNFPNVPLIGNINYLNSNSELPAGFDTFYMTGFNAWGFLGLRWDHACDAGDFNLDYTSKPAATKTWITSVYQNAPVLAEPQQFNFAIAGQCDYSHVMTEVMTFHASTIENTDSYENGATLPSCTQSLLYSIAKAIGYRYTVTQTTTTDSIRANGLFSVAGNFKNIGIAPNYEDYDLFYELRQAGVVKWTGTSNLLFKWFQPGVNNHTDNFTLTNLASGVYDLYMIVRSRKKRLPLYMQITGSAARQTDGSYLLRAGIHTATQGTTPPPPPPPPPNNPPTVFAGAIQTDSLPKNVDTLQGIASDPDGDALTFLWTQTSGPNTATMAASTSLQNRISNLIQGSYRFRLTANDGHGGIASSDADVVVFPANIPPTVKAGSDIFITSPQNRDTLRGIVSDANGDAFTVAWAQLSGPNTATMLTPTAVTNIITGLIVGTYSFKLTANDGHGGIVSDTVSLFLAASAPPNTPPVVNAGNDISITLPVNAASLLATATDADGNTMTYSWVQISGPNTATMSASTSLANNLSNLIQGQYILQFTANDGHSGITSDIVNVFVAPAIPPPPPKVYNPPVVVIDTTGTTIQLPKDSVTLHGHVTVKDTAIQSVQWVLVNTNAMTQGTIVTATDSTTKLRVLSAAGNQRSYYLYKFTVTDKAGNSVDSFIYVYVYPIIPPDPIPLPVAPDPIKYIGIKKAF